VEKPPANQKGFFFILEGQTLLVADVGEEFVSEYDRKNQRLVWFTTMELKVNRCFVRCSVPCTQDKTSAASPRRLRAFVLRRCRRRDLATGYVYCLEACPITHVAHIETSFTKSESPVAK